MTNISHLANHPHHLHIQGYAPTFSDTDGATQPNKEEPKDQNQQPKPENPKETPATGTPPVVTPPKSGYATYIALPFLLVLLLFLFVGCASAQEATLPLPFTSKQLAKYYTESDGNFALHPEYKKQTLNFNEQEVSIVLQGRTICGNKINVDLKYFVIGDFLINDYSYKLIVYENYCNTSSLSINAQLNSYNSDGLLLDALVLENRFAYEDIERFTDFKITKNTINIDYYIAYILETDDDGNIVGPIENSRHELFSQAKYQINNGYFNLISKHDIKLIEN